ncbi:MAG: peptidase U37 [Nitrospirae bacterium]|nr:peptidase U37 [Magnetococcales bacterium]
MAKVIDLPMQVRMASFAPDTMNAEARTVNVVWSTGAAVRRTDWMRDKVYDETLSLAPEHVHLEALNAGAPLLANHDRSNLESIIGVVERAWIANGPLGFEGHATVRFSTREDVNAILNDVKDGIIRNISVGYTIARVEVTEERGKIPQWKAVDWTPKEISIVPVGADMGAGFRAVDGQTIYQCSLENRGTVMSKTIDEGQLPGDQVPAESNRSEPVVAPPVADAQTRSTATEMTEPTLTVRTEPGKIDVEKMIQKAQSDERSRTAAIYDTQVKLGLDRGLADKLVSSGAAVDVARAALIDVAAQRSAATMVTHGVVATAGGQDEKMTRNAAVENALLHRFSPTTHKITDAGREWSGMTLLEMSRSFLAAENVSLKGMSRDQVATRALHTGSDFPILLANVAQKTLRSAYEVAQRTFQSFCRQVTASDFKSVSRVQLGEAPSLEKVAEGGEYKRGSLGETAESYRIETFGKIISISRQVIINDDLQAFTRIPQLFGAAAANLENEIVWGIFTANPKMADNTALFHANHKNLLATGTGLSVASLGVCRKNMGLQTGIDGKTILNIRPSFLIVPAALEVVAEQLLAQNLAPAKPDDVVPTSMRSLSVITEPRLDTNSTTAWYLAASPAALDTIEYAYLEGQQGVYIETKVGFDVDGIEIKARLDFGAKAIDWRGFHKNPGA